MVSSVRRCAGRREARHGAFLVLALAVTVSACRNDVTSATSSGSGGGTSCSGSDGVVEGDILFGGGPPPDAGAVATVSETPGGNPLQVMADAQGHYTVTLAAGTWYVGAQDGDYCQTTMPVAVDLAPCATEQVDLALECVLGSGGAGGSGGSGGSGG